MAQPLMIDPTVPVPWWRVSVMWVFFVLGLGGVVVGSFALLATAIKHADVVELPVKPHIAVQNNSTSPALQARNHAATPTPTSKPATSP